MRILPMLLILTTVSTLLHCRFGKSKDATKPLYFELANVQKQHGNCNGSSPSCARVDVKYPVAMGFNQTACNAINNAILNEVIQNLSFEKFDGSPSKNKVELMADTFLHVWKTIHQHEAEGDSATGWEVVIKGEAEIKTEKVASVTLSTYVYAGGAHPNTFVTILNFDTATGKKLTWEDIVVEPKAFKSLVQDRFRRARGLDLQSDLKREGFFSEEEFKLPQNFEITAEGIYFWYNSDEVAAYPLGPTDFLVSYQELGNLINRHVLLEIGNHKGS